jgi:hypothetical protein
MARSTRGLAISSGGCARRTVLYSAAAILTIGAAAMEWTRLIFQSYVAATVFTLVAAYPLAYVFGFPGIVATWIVVECIRVAVLLAGLRRGTPAGVMPAAIK